jgi:uncharacterized protein with WD repeat
MKLPDHVQKFMTDHHVGNDEIWQVHGTAWVVKHKALERIAAEKKISFQQPHIIEGRAADKIVAICVTGEMGERIEWSIGEAAPYNNKNQYPYAMAEKRAKDRVILKLLNAHGALYSEEEADDFKAASEPEALPKALAQDDYRKLETGVRNAQTSESLLTWMRANAPLVRRLPKDWQETFRKECKEKLDMLKQREAA